jgi:ABC-type multidrug transport system fused ATPase/permease subunit
MAPHPCEFQSALSREPIGAVVLLSSTLLHIIVVIVGLGALLLILKSMVHVAIMNRQDMDIVARLTSRTVHRMIALRVRSSKNYQDTQRTLSWFLGAYILSLIAVYFIGAMMAFALLYWGAWAVPGWNKALIASGSSLTTLGFATPSSPAGEWLAIPEGAMGLGIVVFLFTFIPGFQSSINSRDDQTGWLYARIADFTNQADLFAWFNPGGNTNDEVRIWEMWESWFRLLADSHLQSPMLSVIPSVQKAQSWIVAAAVVLDAAAFSVSTIVSAYPEAAVVCVRTGTRAISLIAEALSTSTSRQEGLGQHISQEAYNNLCDQLVAKGVRLKPDRDTSWSDFIALRSRYTSSICYLAGRAFVPLVDIFGNTHAVPRESGGAAATHWPLSLIPKPRLIRAPRQTKRPR